MQLKAVSRQSKVLYLYISVCMGSLLCREGCACRLHKPWPKLKEYAASIDLQSIDDITHKHVPYGEQEQVAAMMFTLRRL